MRIVIALVLASVLALSACGGGGSGAAPAPAPAPVAPAPEPATANVSVLMFGNSHTAANDLSGILAAMLRAGLPGRSVAVVTGPGGAFLEERLADPASRSLLSGQNWSAVVLQAQKYSESGTVNYSTAEAVEWVRLARLQGAVPVMFPEWPRAGIDETERIFAQHVSIATRQAACVAPIPQAFDLARQRAPALVLHAADGNHSAPAGAFLAALVLYATITGNAPLALPQLALPVDGATQASLRAIADDQVRLLSPRPFSGKVGQRQAEGAGRQ